MLTTLDTYKEYFVGLTADNWLDREEPAPIAKLNRKMAAALAYIAPGHANLYLTAAVMTIRPVSVSHIKDIKAETLRD